MSQKTSSNSFTLTPKHVHETWKDKDVFFRSDLLQKILYNSKHALKSAKYGSKVVDMVKKKHICHHMAKVFVNYLMSMLHSRLYLVIQQTTVQHLLCHSWLDQATLQSQHLSNISPHGPDNIMNNINIFQLSNTSILSIILPYVTV